MSTAIDGRVSTERQTRAHTIDQPIDRLTAYVQAQGEPLRPEDIFRDDGSSGATLSRWAKTRGPSGSCTSGEPWPHMNAP